MFLPHPLPHPPRPLSPVVPLIGCTRNHSRIQNHTFYQEIGGDEIGQSIAQSESTRSNCVDGSTPIGYTAKNEAPLPVDVRETPRPMRTKKRRSLIGRSADSKTNRGEKMSQKRQARRKKKIKTEKEANAKKGTTQNMFFKNKKEEKNENRENKIEMFSKMKKRSNTNRLLSRK